jgi:hypothetical protein
LYASWARIRPNAASCNARFAAFVRTAAAAHPSGVECLDHHHFVFLGQRGGGVVDRIGPDMRGAGV